MLGKYDSLRDSALHFLCSSEWSNDSFGNVESPTGYVWSISNDRQDIFGCFGQGNSELDSVLQDWETENIEVEQYEEFRNSLVGHFLVAEDSNGFVSVTEYPSGESLMQVYTALEEIFSEWNSQDEEN